jgi:hypothetical protein
VSAQIRTKLKRYTRQTPNRIRTFHAGIGLLLVFATRS